MIYVCGPGHGGPGMVANTWMEGTYSEVYPAVTANGGLLLRDLRLPDFRDYGVEVKAPGAVASEPTRVLGTMLHDVMSLNTEARNFRLLGPDETESNRLGAVYEATKKAWNAEVLPVDVNLAPDGDITAAGAPMRTLVVTSLEDPEMASQVREALTRAT